jgi:hypothetical protein
MRITKAMITNLENSNITENKNLPTPSQEFYNMVEELGKSIENTRDIYKKIVEKGHEEGFTDNIIDVLITSYLKGRVHRNTLTNYRKEFLKLPSRDMHKNVQNDYKNNIEESSNQYVPDEAKHVSRLKDTNKEKNLLPQLEAEQSPVGQKEADLGFSEIEKNKKPVGEPAPQIEVREPEPIRYVTIELRMNDCKELKTALNQISLLSGIKFEYDLKRKELIKIL